LGGRGAKKSDSLRSEQHEDASNPYIVAHEWIHRSHRKECPRGAEAGQNGDGQAAPEADEAGREGESKVNEQERVDPTAEDQKESRKQLFIRGRRGG